jgi:hypothetical protein
MLLASAGQQAPGNVIVWSQHPARDQTVRRGWAPTTAIRALGRQCRVTGPALPWEDGACALPRRRAPLGVAL